MTDVVTEKFVPVERGRGVHDATLMVQHVPQPGGEDDEFKAADLALAKRIFVYLTTRFPCGYEWCVNSDLRQGIIKFSIPLLMGVSNWYVVNLRLCSGLDHAVLHGAGEILDRYNLSTCIFSAAALLAAREQHSALVVPGRKVPS